MIGDDAARDTKKFGAASPPVSFAPAFADFLPDRLDQVFEKIDVVVVVLALQHGRDAFEAHAGVDRRTRKIDAVARRALLKLHEDEIPDLDEAIAVGVGGARRAARDLVAVVEEDFRARSARARVAHLPEVVARCDADDLAVGKARDLLPDRVGFVVGMIDRDDEALLVEAEFLGQQVPGELDGAILEIVAEREVAEHLEERVMARGVADVVEVVVLAAGAHAFLRGSGAREWRASLAR